MKYLPTKGNVHAVRAKEEEKKTASGIIVATPTDKTIQERVLIRAIVEAIGDDVDQVKVGDEVYFARYEAFPIASTKSKEGEEFFVPEKFILGKVLSE